MLSREIIGEEIIIGAAAEAAETDVARYRGQPAIRRSQREKPARPSAASKSPCQQRSHQHVTRGAEAGSNVRRPFKVEKAA